MSLPGEIYSDGGPLADRLFAFDPWVEINVSQYSETYNAYSGGDRLARLILGTRILTTELFTENVKRLAHHWEIPAGLSLACFTEGYALMAKAIELQAAVVKLPLPAFARSTERAYFAGLGQDGSTGQQWLETMEDKTEDDVALQGVLQAVVQTSRYGAADPEMLTLGSYAAYDFIHNQVRAADFALSFEPLAAAEPRIDRPPAPGL